MTSPAVRMWVFWSYKHCLVSRAIAAATDGRWSHMGVGFDLADGSRIYYESIYLGGVRGPMSSGHLDAMLAAHSKNARLVASTFLDAERAEQKRAQCETLVGVAGYGHWQLAQMLAFERYGVRVRHSANRMVCSEFASWVLAPEYDLRDRRRPEFDAVSPNSGWRRWVEIAAGYDTVNAPVRAARTFASKLRAARSEDGQP